MKVISKFSLILVSLSLIAPVYAADTNTKPAKDAVSAKILSTIVALDQMELLVGVQASYLEGNPDVADLAKMMIQDHGQNMTQAITLANKLNALPLNPVNDMHEQGIKDLTSLGALDKTKFDTAYADAMVSGHQQALDMVDNKLLKEAKNDDLKAFLTSTRTAIANHLEMAKKVQAALNNK